MYSFQKCLYLIGQLGEMRAALISRQKYDKWAFLSDFQKTNN